MESLLTSPDDFSELYSPSKLLSFFQVSPPSVTFKPPLKSIRRSGINYSFSLCLQHWTVLLYRPAPLAAQCESPALNLNCKLGFIHSCLYPTRQLGFMVTETRALPRAAIYMGQKLQMLTSPSLHPYLLKTKGKSSFLLIPVRKFQSKHSGWCAWSTCASL